MENYSIAIEIMEERFSKDSLIAIATTDGKRLYNRIVDAYYTDGAFYITSNSTSNKAKQIELNNEVAICAVDWFTGHGIGENLGWVLDPKNKEIRLKLREAFSNWYDEANNEEDENCCIIKINLTEGLLVKDHQAIRYKIDFSNKLAKISKDFGEFE